MEILERPFPVKAAANVKGAIVRLMARELADFRLDRCETVGEAQFYRVDLDDLTAVTRLLGERHYSARDIDSLAVRAVEIARALDPQPREVLPGA